MSKVLFFILSIFILLSVSAQDGSLNSDDIVVIKSFQAKIKDANKINFTPQIPEAEKLQSNFKYSIPERLIDLNYQPGRLKPLAVRRLNKRIYYNSFVKVGLGAPLTGLAEIQYHDNVSNTLNFGGYLDHFSSRGSMQNQRYGYSQAGIYADNIGKKTTIGLSADYENSSHRYYGYDNDSFSFTRSQVKQKVNVYDAQAYIKNTKPLKGNWGHLQQIDFYTLSNNYKNNETKFGIASYVHKKFKNDHRIDVDLLLDFFTRTQLPVKSNQNIITIRPAYTFDDDNWKLKVGLAGVFEDSIFHLFPTFITEKRLYEHFLIFYSGWNRQLQVNSYRNILDQNPFITNNIQIRNSRVENRYGGFKGTYQKFNYDLRFTNKVVKWMPLFISDSGSVPTKFVSTYDKNTTIIDFHIELDYNYLEKFRATVLFDYFIYEPDENTRAWHLPKLHTGIALTYDLKKKILFEIAVFHKSGAYALLNNVETRLKGVNDLNATINYNFNDQLTAFISVNNILSGKYQNFGNYPSAGIRGLAGAKFNF